MDSPREAAFEASDGMKMRTNQSRLLAPAVLLSVTRKRWGSNVRIDPKTASGNTGAAAKRWLRLQVPETMLNVSTAVTPDPSSRARPSAIPATTGVPTARPVRLAQAGDTAPQTSDGNRTR